MKHMSTVPKKIRDEGLYRSLKYQFHSTCFFYFLNNSNHRLLVQDSLCSVSLAKCFVLWRTMQIFPGSHYFGLLMSSSAKSCFRFPDLMSFSHKFSKFCPPKWRMFKKCLMNFLQWIGQGRKVSFSILAKGTKSFEAFLWSNDNISLHNIFSKWNICIWF